MSLDPDTEKEILVTPQPRRSPWIGWKKRIEKGTEEEEEEAKESSDKITEAYLSAAEEEEEEEEEHLETIEEHVAGLDRIFNTQY